ncbi:MAG: fibronectin type III domain-containing protein [Bacteroidota bacterium]
MKFRILIVLFAFAGILISACNETTNPTDNPKPQAVSNVRASTLNATEIKIRWDASPSKADALFEGYEVRISPGTFNPISVNKSQTELTISNLTEGTVYTFKVLAKFTNGEYSTELPVTWSPATRFINNNNNAPIYVYEYASLLGSGLDFFSEADGTPKILTVANSQYWNFALDTRVAGTIEIGSPNAVGYNWSGGNPPVTEISSDRIWDSPSLDSVFDSQALSAASFQERTVWLDDPALNIQSGGVVIVMRTKEGNSAEWTYVKIWIKKTANGWLQGSSPNRYIECVLSYQKVPGVPYAL